MRAGRAGAITVVVLGLLVVTSPLAAAGGAPLEVESGVEAGFELNGSHGYSISVIAGPEEGSGRGTMVIAVHGHAASVIYRAPATVTPNTVRADLGDLGRIDLVRIPSGRKKTVRLKCFRQGLTYEPAIYEGTIEFRGERGYTRATQHRVAQMPAMQVATSGDHCAGGSGFGEAISAEEHGARLRGISFARGRTLSFQLNKNSAASKTLISAEVKERRDDIWIRRELLARLLPAGAFRFDASLKTARLKPPAPFSGFASLTWPKGSVSPVLRGNLSLEFPGRTVPVTGPAVHVTLVHARYTRGDDGEVEIGFRQRRHRTVLAP